MIQAKFSIENAQAEFINQYKEYGFKDKSAVIRAALELLKKDLEREKLKFSADLYAELYEEDKALQELTESAIEGWPA